MAERVATDFVVYLIDFIVVLQMPARRYPKTYPKREAALGGLRWMPLEAPGDKPNRLLTVRFHTACHHRCPKSEMFIGEFRHRKRNAQNLLDYIRRIVRC